LLAQNWQPQSGRAVFFASAFWLFSEPVDLDKRYGISKKKRAKARVAQLSSGAAQTHPQLGAFFCY